MDPRSGSVVVIGAGVAGLITAHTLLQDGFDVQVLTQDEVVGGVWSRERIYPGLKLNNVHGEYRFSPMPMQPLLDGPDSRPTGNDMCTYMETFASKFLKGRIQFGIEVRRLRRSPTGTGWQMDVFDRKASKQETRDYARVVLCTGGCHTPKIPDYLSPSRAKSAGFKGMVFHSIDLGPKLPDLLAAVPPSDDPTVSEVPPIVVIGGGKSSEDVCAYLANAGRKVALVCTQFNAFTASPKLLPDFIRKSRFFSILSPHVHLRTALERFIHSTWIGKEIVSFVWKFLVDSSFKAADIPEDSPLRNTASLFWDTRINDEGVARKNGFHALAVSGKIQLYFPARVNGYGDDGCSVLLDDGRAIPASAVIIGTGYTSSWPAFLDEEALEEFGLAPRPAEIPSIHQWNYTTLANPPPPHPDAARWSSPIYRGLVPAKLINSRDFASNGTVISTNFPYTTEVASHWISSYFLGDDMPGFPTTPEETLERTERDAAWLRTRHPRVPTARSGSRASFLTFWTWPQHVDDLLEDMGLPVMRSGGNWLTWPFKTIELDEIKTLKEERDARRALREA